MVERYEVRLTGRERVEILRLIEQSSPDDAPPPDQVLAELLPSPEYVQEVEVLIGGARARIAAPGYRLARRSRTFDPPEPAVRRCVLQALDEDLLPLGDLSTALIPPDTPAVAVLSAREPGVLAGARCAEATLAALDPALEIVWYADDGDELLPGVPLAEISGPARSLLTAERTVLNFLCHLSGVATMSRAFARTASGITRVRDSRKTTPGLRALEKAAVRAGGATNHRGTLSEAILIKDNHLALVGIRAAIATARETWPDHRVQVECDSIAAVQECLASGADAVLLDNMTPDLVREAVGLVDRRLFVEASGGITLDNLADYTATGVDAVAIGALTHSAPAIDIGIDFQTQTGNGAGAQPDAPRTVPDAA